MTSTHNCRVLLPVRFWPSMLMWSTPNWIESRSSKNHMALLLVLTTTYCWNVSPVFGW